MKRKTIALLLALVMCLALLSACGGNSAADTSKPPSSESTAQPTEGNEKPEESTKQPEESAEPSQEPEESEEPSQEPEQEENEGTKLIALLQEEWNNGFYQGEGPRHTYFNFVSSDSHPYFIHKGVVYLAGLYADKGFDISAYDIASKELRESVSLTGIIRGSLGYSTTIFLDGNFYFLNWAFNGNPEWRMYDGNGALLLSTDREAVETKYSFLEQGILRIDSNSTVLFSYNFETIAEIPIPQRDIEHGLKEDEKLFKDFGAISVDGTVYLYDLYYGTRIYRLNMDTYEWESTELPEFESTNFTRRNTPEAFSGEICDIQKGQWHL